MTLFRQTASPRLAIALPVLALLLIGLVLGSATMAYAQLDLGITKTHSGNFTQGDSGKQYTITVTFTGPGLLASNVTVTDTLPAGLTAPVSLASAR